MTAFENVLGRADTAALVPEEVSKEMLGKVATVGSAVLQTFKRIPVTTAQERFPILSALPQAYWVTGDTGLKETTEEKWSNKFINIEELAVIVPVPENVLDDVEDGGDFDLWGEISPDVETAIGRALDEAVFFGTNKPATFPNAIYVDAEARENEYEEASTVEEGGVQNDIDKCIEHLEPQGFDASAIVANRTLKSKLRRARSTIGERLSGVNPAITEYLDLPISYPMRGQWPTGAKRVEAFIGDFSEYVVGVRKDITFKLLTEAVLTNAANEIIVNLAQQDMVAMRFTFRAGVQVSNRIRYDQTDESKRYPVAVLKSKS